MDGGRLEGLKDILQDIITMFEADGYADEAVADACGCPFFGGQFGVCRAGGMGRDAASIAQVGCQR